jgi:putative redox protein
MQVDCEWKEKLYLEGKAGAFTVGMDTKSPLGTDRAASPKQLLLMSICGCAGMDIASLLKKYREPLTSLKISADAPLTQGQPAIFETIHLIFKITGTTNAEKVNEAVMLSMTKYCGVSAMVNATSPIQYSVELNGTAIGSGHAKFEV